MPRAAALSPQDIQRRIQQLGAWFQNLDLQGIPTAPEHYLGDYPAAKWRQISPALPARLDGLTVLDIGCNAGFHALECKRRGARRVMGIDADPHYLAQARFAAEVLELDVEWRHLSVYALSELLAETGSFDYVFFMGVFYHLRYPVYALDLVVKAVRRRLVFQTMLRGAASSDAPLRNDYSFWDHTPFVASGFPCLHLIEHSYAGDPTNWWIPNRTAAEALLRTAGLEIEAHPEAETWICRPRPAAVRDGNFVWDLELAARL